MRPIRIAMTAFGPFAETQVVDFRELGDASLFLLSGPTGAGKTFIMDGLFFGLFGEASGDERGATELRSHYADPQRITEVTVDFSLGREVYRVCRSPQQLRPTKRGVGVTTERPKATLWRRTGLAENAPNPKPAAEGARPVTDEVEALLGLEADQYRKTGVLPQGAFRKVISSKSEERAGILAKLFGTQRYRTFEERVDQRTKEMARALEDVELRRQAILGEAAVDSVRELAESVVGLEAQEREAGQRAEEVRGVFDEAEKALQKGRESHQVLEELREATHTDAKLAGRVAAMAERRAELQQADRAATLDDVERDRDQRRTEARLAQEQLQKATRTLQEVEKKLENARAELQRQEVLAPRRQGLTDERARFDAMADKVARLDEARRNQCVTEQARVEAKAATGNRTAALEEARGAQKTAGVALEEARLQATHVEGTREALQQISERYRQRKKYQEATEALGPAGQAAKAAEVQRGKAEKALNDAQAHWNEVNEARFRGQAVVLARALISGEACPVCGSGDHPSPAAGNHPIPGAADLKEAEGKRAKAEKLLDQARTGCEVERSGLARLESEAKVLADSLGDEAKRSLEELEKEGAKLREAANRAQKAHQDLAGLGEQVTATEKAAVEAEAALALARDAEASALAATNAAAATLRERGAGIPEELRATVQLQAARNAVDHELTQLEKALKTAREGENEARGAASAGTASGEAAAASVKVADERAAAAEGKLSQRILEADFANALAFQTAKRDRETREDLRTSVNQFDQNRQVAAERLLAARQKADGVVQPDLEALMLAHQVAQAARDEQSQAQGVLAQKRKTQALRLGKIEALAKERSQQQEEFRVMGHLAEVAKGKNPARLSFERYVLAAMLDEVLVISNEHLRRMSAGRYQLKRAADAGDKRRKAGLDLEVFDSYTGQTRSASTLSGGEGFEASLALALGLSDHVKATSGGVHLDAIFVDEGFGTLGPEDLDAVMTLLQELQAGGRLVGVISHVDRLKERIETRLEVEKGSTGSVARFVLP